jgi:cob(I)alamin adenosyltransferase
MSIKIYTKTGDDGTTGLFGGERVRKDSSRIEAYGTVDELNSGVGLAAAVAPQALAPVLRDLQISLFVLGADLATPIEQKITYSIPRVEESDVKRLEALIDEHTSQLPPLKSFILPGGTDCAARLHLARTICRRAERLLVTLRDEQEIGAHDLVYLNRLSDLLFTLARRANQLAGVEDVEWDGKKAG